VTDVLILAGQREGVVDPLCEMAGIARKALLPVRGVPQIDRVGAALDGAGFSRPYRASGLGQFHEGFVEAPSGAGPADSAWQALEGAEYPCLLTTADHPLLSADMVEVFVREAHATGADFVVGLASRATIQADVPETTRTYLKFSDVQVSGCNLFYLRNAEGRTAIAFWKRAQAFRKRPVRLAASVGLGVLLQYVLGQLSLRGAFAFASRKIGIVAAPVLLPFARAAIDLDKPSDLELIERLLDADG